MKRLEGTCRPTRLRPSSRCDCTASLRHDQYPHRGPAAAYSAQLHEGLRFTPKLAGLPCMYGADGFFVYVDLMNWPLGHAIRRELAAGIMGDRADIPDD